MNKINPNHSNEHVARSLGGNLRFTYLALFTYKNVDRFFCLYKRGTSKMKLHFSWLILIQFLLISYSCSPAYSNPTLVSQFSSSTTLGYSYLTVFNLKLYFIADDGVIGRELWVYDGVSPPVNVADINPGILDSFSSGVLSDFTVFNSKLYFSATDGTNGLELWAYDGESPPSNVADIDPGVLSSFPSGLTVYNSKLYFRADDGTTGRELWVYDGNNPPTRVADINPNGDSSPGSLTVYNSKLYFSADDGTNGRELWVYDENNSPTRVANINPNGDSSPDYLTVFNSKLYFGANDGINGQELWVYDGNNPPAMIANINPNPVYQGVYGEWKGFSSPKNFTIYNSKLYFSAHDGTNGYELWVYDGTNPPAMVANINPYLYGYYKGNESGCSYPSYLTVLGSTLYFRAYDGSGYMLFGYDGTNPPAMVGDIPLNNPTYTQPYFLTAFDSDLYFYSRSRSGFQLWLYKPPRPPAPKSKSIAPFLSPLLNN
jgi:ELWxxDGT repeat protein